MCRILSICYKYYYEQGRIVESAIVDFLLQPVLDICLYVYQLTSSIGAAVRVGGEKGR